MPDQPTMLKMMGDIMLKVSRLDPKPGLFGRRKSSHAVAQSPFAGRIGGNQEFVLSRDDEAAEEVLKKLPDAVRV